MLGLLNAYEFLRESNSCIIVLNLNTGLLHKKDKKVSPPPISMAYNEIHSSPSVA